LAELYENEQLRQAAKFRGGIGGGASTASELSGPPRVDVESWLAADPGNGFVRVYSAIAGSGGGIRTGGGHGASRLVPCTTATTAYKVTVFHHVIIPVFLSLADTVILISLHNSAISEA
jgi:hypothetical protein